MPGNSSFFVRVQSRLLNLSRHGDAGTGDDTWKLDMRAWPLILAVLPLVGGLASQESAAANPQGLEPQERCSSLSGEYFAKEHGAGVSTNDYVDSETRKILHDETHITFANHYNVKEKRCLIVITSIAATRLNEIENTSTWILLIDLNQHHTVGMFHQTNRGPYADVCFIGPQSCHSREQWDSLLKPYLRD